MQQYVWPGRSRSCRAIASILSLRPQSQTTSIASMQVAASVLISSCGSSHWSQRWTNGVCYCKLSVSIWRSPVKFGPGWKLSLRHGLFYWWFWLTHDAAQKTSATSPIRFSRLSNATWISTLAFHCVRSWRRSAPKAHHIPYQVAMWHVTLCFFHSVPFGMTIAIAVTPPCKQ